MFFRVIKKLQIIFYSPVRLAKFKGVVVGNNPKIPKIINFGSEPYLISIGNDFYCSSNVTFLTHDGSVHVIRNKYPELADVDLIKPISIGNNVFLGWGVTLLAGTSIGDNVIVGANSLVKGALNSNSVYAGTPCRFICTIDEYLDKNSNMFLNTKTMPENEKKAYLCQHFNSKGNQ